MRGSLEGDRSTSNACNSNHSHSHRTSKEQEGAPFPWVEKPLKGGCASLHWCAARPCWRPPSRTWTPEQRWWCVESSCKTLMTTIASEKQTRVMAASTSFTANVSAMVRFDKTNMILFISHWRPSGIPCKVQRGKQQSKLQYWDSDNSSWVKHSFQFPSTSTSSLPSNKSASHLKSINA